MRTAPCSLESHVRRIPGRSCCNRKSVARSTLRCAEERCPRETEGRGGKGRGYISVPRFFFFFNKISFQNRVKVLAPSRHMRTWVTTLLHAPSPHGNCTKTGQRGPRRSSLSAHVPRTCARLWPMAKPKGATGLGIAQAEGPPCRAALAGDGACLSVRGNIAAHSGAAGSSGAGTGCPGDVQAERRSGRVHLLLDGRRAAGRAGCGPRLQQALRVTTPGAWPVVGVRVSTRARRHSGGFAQLRTVSLTAS